MEIHLKAISPDDREPVIDILNFYIENTAAEYPDKQVPYEFFDLFLTIAESYPVIVAKDEGGQVVGFGMLRPYNPLPAFVQTAECSYFIKPEYTRQGIGGRLLEALVHGGRERGITSILASVSSLNKDSINFHKKNGFIECGRFQKIGVKKGQLFDVVWLQKMLEP